jgi:putative nucleotidyltransferase with HDIG domain
MSERITQKGEFQVVSSGLRSDIEHRFRALFGLETGPTTRDWALMAYTLGLTLIFGLVVALAVLTESATQSGPIWPLAALATSAFVAERQTVRLNARAAISVSFLPIVIAAVICGPLGAVGVSVASLLCDFRSPYARWATWTASRSIAAGAAGFVALRVDAAGTHGFARVAAAVAAATMIQQLGDLSLGSVAAWLRGMTVREIAKLSNAVFIAMPLYAPITALLVYTYREVSPWSVALFLFPAFAAQKLFLLYQEQRTTAEELAAAMDRQEKANLSFASALVATLDARDRYTAGHSAAVAVYARDIARRLGLGAAEQELVRLCGLVHDIGKVGLAAGLLEKPGPLTLSERRQMEEHPVIGERILAKIEDYAEIAKIVRYHHERVDGQGYPDGLADEEIPLISRILAVADAYDAMTSDRPYRDAMPSQVARMRMAQAVGSQFDTSVVAAFEAILAQATEAYRLGVGPEFLFAAEDSPLSTEGHREEHSLGRVPRLQAQVS